MKVSAAGIDRLRCHKSLCPAELGAISARYFHGARVLNDVIGLLADEIAVLDKAIAAGRSHNSEAR